MPCFEGYSGVWITVKLKTAADESRLIKAISHLRPSVIEILPQLWSVVRQTV